MDTFQLTTVCPDCGQKHSGITHIQGQGGLKDGGFGVCAQCGYIFAILREGEQVNTRHLSAEQLSRMAQVHPQMFYKLVVASIEIKNFRFRSQKN